ncbi:MAG: hypothetical protein V1749_00765 [Candidatus Desantisbacteria bacterium]
MMKKNGCCPEWHKIYGKYLTSGAWTQKEYQNHILPLIAFTEHANAKEFRKKVIANLGMVQIRVTN